jgi:hypothetical protein
MGTPDGNLPGIAAGNGEGGEVEIDGKDLFIIEK